MTRIKYKEVVNLNRNKISVLFTLLLVIFITSGCEEDRDKKTQTSKEVISVKQAGASVNGKAEIPLEAPSVQPKTEPSVPVKKAEPVQPKKEQVAPMRKEQPALKRTETSAPTKILQTAPSKVEPVIKEVMPSEHYIDGTYIGEGQGKKGPIKVEVTIKDHRIANIQVKEHGESEGIAEMAFNTVKEFILQQQTVSVEAMSGATKSSQGFKDAVKAALLLSIEVKE